MNASKGIIFLSALFLYTATFQTKAQDRKDFALWKTLSLVDFRKKYDPALDADVLVPEFSEKVLAFRGKEITIEGYVIPLEIGSNYFVISAYPFKACYFCGQAGPETVMEVYVRDKVKAFAHKTVKLRGRLELNTDDINHLFYMLKDAEQLD